MVLSPPVGSRGGLEQAAIKWSRQVLRSSCHPESAAVDEGSAVFALGHGDGKQILRRFAPQNDIRSDFSSTLPAPPALNAGLLSIAGGASIKAGPAAAGPFVKTVYARLFQLSPGSSVTICSTPRVHPQVQPRSLHACATRLIAM